MPSSFVFTGHPAYLEAAAQDYGRPDLARAAGRLAALTAAANLCAQASRAEPVAVAPILAQAGEHRDQLAIALAATDAMIADVESATWFDPESTPAEVEMGPDPSRVSPAPAKHHPNHRRKRGRP